MAERGGPSNTFIASNCLSGELDDGLDDYLSSERYMDKGSNFFWEIEPTNYGKRYRDNCDNYWCQSGTFLELTDENGQSISGKHSINIMIEPEKNIKGFLDIEYDYILDPDSCEVKFIHQQIITDEHGIEITGLYYESYDVNELEDELRAEDKYISTNKQKCIEVKPLSRPVLFKHGNALIDSRKLSKSCWFKKYHVTTIDDDLHSEFDVLTILAEGTIGETILGKDAMPYLWWLTDNIPHKEGYIAFQDVHGNAFYVGNKKNVGEVVVCQGKPVENENIEIHIIFNGYFNITAKKLNKKSIKSI